MRNAELCFFSSLFQSLAFSLSYSLFIFLSLSLPLCLSSGGSHPAVYTEGSATAYHGGSEDEVLGHVHPGSRGDRGAATGRDTLTAGSRGEGTVAETFTCACSIVMWSICRYFL